MIIKCTTYFKCKLLVIIYFFNIFLKEIVIFTTDTISKVLNGVGSFWI